MEEIKFRAWDTLRKEMTDWNGILSADSMSMIFEMKRVILMQFSGVEDKNKKEIYEGDIILIKTWLNFFKRKAIVKFDCGSFVAGGEPLSNWTDVEIVGNKFENPELAKEVENN